MLSEFPLVSHAIAVCFRGENAEVSRNGRSIRRGLSSGRGSGRLLLGKPRKFDASGCARRYLRRHFNVQPQPAACRYFNYLFTQHEKIIA